MKKNWFVALPLVLMILVGAPHAAKAVSSSFDSGDEGWRVVNWDGEGSPVTPDWYSTGGNPGGYIAAGDVHGDGFFKAPDTFHGNFSAAYGSSLSYDSFTSYSGWSMSDIYIQSGTNTITYRFGVNPNTTWTHFSAPLSVGSWMWGLYYDDSGPLATEAQIKSVLSNVTDLRIRQEFAYGSDWTGLDNVVLGAPTTGYLYVSKTAGCGGKSPCYSTIQAALSAAADGDMILVGQGIFNEAPVKNTAGTATISGGWDGAFTAQTPRTTSLRGPRAAQGTLVLQEVVVIP